MAHAPWVRLRSPDLLPQVPFSSLWWQREVQLCSTLVNMGIRWQNRFCLAHKNNNVTTTINQIWSGCLVFPPPFFFSYAGFRGFLNHSFLSPSHWRGSVRNMNITTLPPAELQMTAGGPEHLASGAQRFQHDPLRHSFLLTLLSTFSAPRLILETHP